MHGWKACDVEFQSYFVLGDLWESFKEWSAYGIGVPLILDDGDSVIQFYVPYLSGIQIYGKSVKSCASPSRQTEGSDSDFRDSSSDGSDDCEPERLKCSGELWNPHHLTNALPLRMERLPLRDQLVAHQEDGSSDEGESLKSQGYLLFEYLERDPPCNREPLSEKLLEIASHFPEMKTLRSCDLMASSWISVAWYPIYKIPTGPTLKDLDACFLTYHWLHSPLGGAKTAQSPVVEHPSEIDGTPKMSLPVFGLASYKFRGSLWTPTGGSENQLSNSLLQAADRWLRHLQTLYCSSFLMAAIIFAVVSLFTATAILTLILTIASHIVICRRNRKTAVGFFHPYTNDGGGGERVLWCAVKAIQEETPHLHCVIYTGDHDASPYSLAARALDRFGVKLIHPPMVVHLYKRKWIEETTFPHFTMIGQSFGSIYLSWEALCKFTPLYYFDTSGYAFTYPLARLFGCKVICYTHYPTISLDMISRVHDRTSMYNNDAYITKSGWLSQCKLLYYRVFSWMYGFVGSCTQLAMVNSSWTQSHIEKLWRIPNCTKRVYPPCDTSGLQVLPLERASETPILVSVAQFRPEKAHLLQLEALSLAIKKLGGDFPRPKLQFVGSCRNKADEERLQNLQDKAIKLNIEEFVEFHKNVTYRDLMRLLGGAIAGMHSMVDEHFGISVVEYMAAGAIPIAHNSAGPKMDIILEEDGQQTGYLCRNVEEYADAILKVIRMSEMERLKMAAAARRRAGRFSEQRFYEDFKAAIRSIIEP